MLVIACLATFAPLGDLPSWVLALPWLITAGLVGTFVLLPRLAVRFEKFKMLLNGLGWSSGRWGSWWQAVGLSVIVQALATLQVILLGVALDLPVPWLGYFVVVPLVTLLTMLPITFNGIGVREGSLVLLLASYGVTEEQAITLGVGWFALSLSVGLVGGVIYLFFDQVGQAPACPSKDVRREPDLQTIPSGKDSHGSVDHRADEGRAGQRRAAA